MSIRRYLNAVLSAILSGLSALTPGQAADAIPPIRHVFVIVLENEGYEQTFGSQSPAPYLTHTLIAQGALLTQYFGTGHASLDNYVAMISGQAATPETRADCRVFEDFVQSGMAPNGQAVGHGCVYPATIKTLADQLTAAGLDWRGYMEDMGSDPQRGVATSCGQPTIGAADLTQRAAADDQYAARHNPFVYFHSIIDGPDCGRHVVRLDHLPADLQSIDTTPAFNFITPNLCHDGHDEPCRNGEHGGLESADDFLRKWVPVITTAPAFTRDGLLIVTFDESDATSRTAKPGGGMVVTYAGASCCNQYPGPNLGAFPQQNSYKENDYITQSFGGDRIGAVLISPFIKPGTISTVGYNHYSMLRSIEDLFHLDGHLGYAGQDGLASFGADIFGTPPAQ
jgi:phosphatidylinositol-3-phosphatase